MSDETTISAARDRTAAARAAKAAKKAAQGREEPFNGAPEAAFDHDGDGKPGGSLPKEPEDEAALVARAKEQRKAREDAEIAAAQRDAAKRAQTPVPDAAGPSRLERAAAAQEAEAAQRQDLARAVASGSPQQDMVRVRVTKQGDGKIPTCDQCGRIVYWEA